MALQARDSLEIERDTDLVKLLKDLDALVDKFRNRYGKNSYRCPPDDARVLVTGYAAEGVVCPYARPLDLMGAHAPREPAHGSVAEAAYLEFVENNVA